MRARILNEEPDCNLTTDGYPREGETLSVENLGIATVKSIEPGKIVVVWDDIPNTLVPYNYGKQR